MLTIFSKPHKGGGFCDGLNRRDFLTIGGSIAGGLMLPGLLRAEAEQRRGTQHKSIINIYLPGGPPHQDMWDLKPDAPREIRGEFNPIHTNVPGIDICELFPRIASQRPTPNTSSSAPSPTPTKPTRRLPEVHDLRPQEPRRPKKPLADDGLVGVALPGRRQSFDPRQPLPDVWHRRNSCSWGDPYHGGFLGTWDPQSVQHGRRETQQHGPPPT